MTRRTRSLLRCLNSLRTRLIVAALAATAVGLAAMLVLTIAGVNSYLRSRLENQLTSSLALIVDYLAKVPQPAWPPPGLPSHGGECITLVTDHSGQLLAYYGGRPARLPTPPPSLLHSMAADHTTGLLPGSDFLGGVGELPNGNYVVAAVSTGDYQQIFRHLVFVEGSVLLLVLVLLTAVLLPLIKRWLLPLRSVVTTARRIAGGDLSHRVEAAGSGYEVASLTRSFNTMLGRLQDSFVKQQRAEDRLRQFVAAAAHELRTPLSAISGYAQLTRLGVLNDPGELNNAMRRVHNETKRMTALIEELLMLAELDLGRPDEAEPVDLGPLCLDAVQDAQAAAPEWTFTHDIDDREYLVAGDAFRLRQVVSNLLSNIRAHTPEGTSGALTLSTSDGQHVIDIVDDGPGIPADLHEQVFERFFRADPAARHGSGLGLSIVAELIECHGGTIQALPTAHGSWFRIRLPVLPVLPARPEAAAEVSHR